LKFKATVCIPTYNAGEIWEDVLQSIGSQQNIDFRKIIVDSGSTDNTVSLSKQYGFEILQIDKSAFNHGATRQLLVDSSGESDVCIFLTQDAVLSDSNSLINLIKAFTDPEVGIAYGRQLPRIGAKPLEAHLRGFNYPEKSNVRSVREKGKLGFKVFFCSNSYAAYRKTALVAVGGFPSESIMGEDAIVGAKMIKAGFKIAYVAEAVARHSHDYTVTEEFKRYFDTRVFHEQNNWLIKEYGKPTGEGLKYVKSEIQYTLFNHPAYIFKSVASIFAKWMGYKMGGFYNKMPLGMLKKVSMHKHYWK
jgi:rhamnosyltransferase